MTSPSREMSDKGAIIALCNYALNTEANLTEVRDSDRDKGIGPYTVR